MDSRILRIACEEAGLVIIEERGGSWTAVTPDQWGRPFAFSRGNPGLPPYVASLLVAKIAKTGRAITTGIKYGVHRVQVHDHGSNTWADVEDRDFTTAIVYAALNVLRPGWREET